MPADDAETTDPAHLAENVAAWNENAAEYAAHGREAWTGEPHWGVFGIPEAEVEMLAGVAGKDVVELGCGTAYVSKWVAEAGGRPVAFDPTPNQLANAVAFRDEFGPRFPILRAAAERAPFRDESFDVAISEYGAAIWADPYRWIPEAARLLRPGGELVFLGNSALFMLTTPEIMGLAGAELVRPYKGMYRFDWPDEPGIEFHLPHGEWIRLFRDTGFEVLELRELHVEPTAIGTGGGLADRAWAERWPIEEVWRVRKQG